MVDENTACWSPTAGKNSLTPDDYRSLLSVVLKANINFGLRLTQITRMTDDKGELLMDPAMQEIIRAAMREWNEQGAVTATETAKLLNAKIEGEKSEGFSDDAPDTGNKKG